MPIPYVGPEAGAGGLQGSIPWACTRQLSAGPMMVTGTRLALFWHPVLLLDSEASLRARGALVIMEIGFPSSLAVSGQFNWIFKNENEGLPWWCSG